MNLAKMGVQEMNTSEMRKERGGLLGLILVAAAVLLVSSCTPHDSDWNGN